MSNKEMLEEILSDEFFYNSIALTVKTTVYLEGIVTPTLAPPVNIDAIVQVVSPKLLISLGLGSLTDQENFSIFTDTEIDFAKSNYIAYEGKNYKIIKALPWRGYGFRKYIMTQFNGDFLNDN